MTKMPSANSYPIKIKNQLILKRFLIKQITSFYYKKEKTY